MLRKINAVISLLITVLLLDHAIFIALWMLSRGSIVKSVDVMPWIMTGLMAVHAIISVDLALSGYAEEQKIKGKIYFKLNRATILQRVSGVLMILFTGLHIAGATGLMQPPPVIHAILPPLFFFVALSHVALSVGKALVTLGIGSARFVKNTDTVIKVICAVTLVADVVGFYLYVC